MIYALSFVPFNSKYIHNFTLNLSWPVRQKLYQSGSLSKKSTISGLKETTIVKIIFIIQNKQNCRLTYM